MDLISVLSIVSISLYTLLGILLLLGIRGRSAPNKFLGAFFLLWAWNFLDGLLLLNGFFLVNPQLAMWEEPMALLYGPLIFFYTRSLIRELDTSFRSLFPHFIPFLLFTGILLFMYHFQTPEFKLGIIESAISQRQHPAVFSAILLVFMHVFVYVLFAFRSLRRYHSESRNFHSSETQWLDKTLRFLILILVVSFVISIFQYTTDPTLFELGLIILIVLILAFISRIFFQVFEDPGLFVGDSTVERYRSNPIEKEKQDEIEMKIKEAMEVERIFLNSDLTIDDMASFINEGSRSVSQVINERFGQSFFDLVNTYRVKESERIFRDNKDPGKTVLEVIYESGFKSKSSFNAQFKKRTGITPTEYKNLHS